MNDGSAGGEHLAVVTARAAGLVSRGEARVELLKNHQKSMVFRVVDVGRSLIAKRAYASALATERFLYTRLLPSLPGPHIRYLGSWQDADPSFHWLFLEDAGDRAYDSAVSDERLMVGRVLGALHASTRTVERNSAVSVRTSDDYLGYLYTARGRIAAAVQAGTLEQTELETLSKVIAQLNVIERHWGTIITAVQSTSTVLTHGDVQPKNVRIPQGDAGSPRVMLIDWEFAAWDSPAIDLQAVEGDGDPLLHGYLETSERLLEGRFERALELASYGRLLRLIHTVEWASRDLLWPHLRPVIHDFTVYRRRLDAAFERTGLT